MLKEFIEHIQNTTQPQIVEKDGATFVVYAGEAPHQLRPDIDHPDTLPLHSLDALVKLVRTEASKVETPLYITIPDHLIRPAPARCPVLPAGVLRGQGHRRPRLG